MELDVLMNAIGSVGFPIAMCIYVMVTNNKTINELRQTIADNTKVLDKILEHFRGDDA